MMVTAADAAAQARVDPQRCPMRITLLRHGKPMITRAPALDVAGFVRFRESYDAAAIDAAHAPPPGSVAAVRESTVIVCSDLPRSIESASLLAPQRTPVIDAAFREVTYPWRPLGRLKMPSMGWMMLFRAMWFVGFSRGSETRAAASRRAEVCARRLVGLAETHGSVALIGHGLTNFLIAAQLRSVDWNGPRVPSRAYWGVARYAPGSGAGGRNGVA